MSDTGPKVTYPDTLNYGISDGGTWVASNDADGNTIWTETAGSYVGTQVSSADGPVGFYGGTLNIPEGVTVNHLFTSGVAVVNVNGTLTNSSINNSYTNISSTGVSSGNDYNSTVVAIGTSSAPGGTSTNDNFLDTGVTPVPNQNAPANTYSPTQVNNVVPPTGTFPTNIGLGDGTRSITVNGGTVNSPNIQSTGGPTYLTNGGSIYATGTAPDVLSAPTSGTVVSGGVWTASTSPSGQTLWSNGTTTYVQDVDHPVFQGSTVNIPAGVTVSGLSTVGISTVNVDGTLENSYLGNGYLNVNSGGVSSGNTLNSSVTTINAGGTSVNDTVMDTYPQTPYTVINGVNYSIADNINGSYNAAGSTVSNQNVVTYTGDTGTVTVAPAGYAGLDPCFLADSLIKTPSGDVPVQDLRAGDEIITLSEGGEAVRTVVWSGYHTVTVRDRDSFPVRILKDALGENIPYRDLLVTGDHCLCIEGRLIPARMLVNGRSIIQETSFRAYEVFHVELEPHAIILANGVPTESYLNTGGQSLTGADGVVKGAFATKSWAAAAAPLTVSREMVEPVFRAIEARAEQAGLENTTSLPSLTDDANLHLVTDKGSVIESFRVHGDRWLFKLPAGVASVSVASRTSRPSEVIGPFVDDRRELGVLVGHVLLAEGDQISDLTAHLTDASLSGWHDAEQGARWTAGYGVLPLGERRPNCPAVLQVQVLAGGPYLAADDQQENASLRA